MATGDERALHESLGHGEMSHLRPEIKEESQNVSKEAGRNNSSRESEEGGSSASVSVATWTFTRSEIQNPTTVENLPHDILLNIFIRLLAKQLAQMRCISKCWKALLSQSSFIKSHLHRSINNDDRILLVLSNYVSYDPKPMAVHPVRSRLLELTSLIKLPLIDPKSGHTDSFIQVIGSVHGLICYRYIEDDIHIWNPSLSAVLTVPPHSMHPCGTHFSFFRFGYDPKTDDYKIVNVKGLIGTSPLAVEEWLPVEVYSMRKGSWKFIAQSFPSHLKGIFKSNRICVDGHDGRFHWCGYVGEWIAFETIVTFDLSSETFSEISLPDSLVGCRRQNLLGVLNGRLCVFTLEAVGGVFEVWVMDEYGVTESWVKRHVFSQFDNDASSFGFTSHNEFLTVDGSSRIVLYDPTARKTKTLGNFCGNSGSIDSVVEYVDSLIWVAPSERGMVDGAGQNSNREISSMM